MTTRRIEAVLEGKTGSRVLVGLPESCDLEQLRSLLEKRLGVRPEQLYVGHAQLQDVADLRDGDTVTVAWGTAPCSLLQREPTESRWYPVIHTVITLIVFVLLNELFQRYVFFPWFHPEPQDEVPGNGRLWEQQQGDPSSPWTQHMRPHAGRQL